MRKGTRFQSRLAQDDIGTDIAIGETNENGGQQGALVDQQIKGFGEPIHDAALMAFIERP